MPAVDSPLLPAVLRALLLAVLLVLAPFARAATEITFYYPIAVGGPVAKTMTRLVEDFEREHPDIKVRPIYTGTYRESLTKALTAHRSGNPPDVAVLFAVDMYTLIDAEAILPFDDLLDANARATWLSSFYPAFMANSRAAGKTWGVPFQRSFCIGTSACSARRGSMPTVRRRTGMRWHATPGS